MQVIKGSRPTDEFNKRNHMINDFYQLKLMFLRIPQEVVDLCVRDPWAGVIYYQSSMSEIVCSFENRGFEYNNPGGLLDFINWLKKYQNFHDSLYFLMVGLNNYIIKWGKDIFYMWYNDNGFSYNSNSGVDYLKKIIDYCKENKEIIHP